MRLHERSAMGRLLFSRKCLQLPTSQADHIPCMPSSSPVQQLPATASQSGGAGISAAKTLLITAGRLCALWLLGVLVAVVLDR